MAKTNDRGVDVVLNSLSGAYVDKGLSVLAPFGRFVEIGKRDVYEDSRLGMHALRRNLSFHVVDLAELAIQRPKLLRQGMSELSELFATGKLSPLPVETFPAGRATDAFRYLAAAKHIGKVVVTMDDRDTRVMRSLDGEIRLPSDATYLVTGGLGGFGLAAARWLVTRGVRRLVLMGRSGAPTPRAEETIAELRAEGADVGLVQGDVARLEDIERIVAEIDASPSPLQGIVHAAGVIDDGFVAQLDKSRLRRVLEPKLAGAWNLHRATLGRQLGLFLLFSSLSAITGPPGQGNYAAANAFLDALARHRRGKGLTALCVDWGAISDAGYLARTPEVARYLEDHGVTPMPAESALGRLDRLLRQEVAAIVVADVDWRRIGKVRTRRETIESRVRSQPHELTVPIDCN